MFSLSFQNKNLVDCLLQEFYKEKLFEIIAQHQEIDIFKSDIPDLAQMLKVKEDLYRDFNKEPLKASNLHGPDVFHKITDKVFKYRIYDSKANLSYIYKHHLSKLLTMKNLYGIVGKDATTGEVINFTNPFRILSLIHNNPILDINNLYVYKKDYPFDETIKLEKKEAISNMLTILLEIYRKGLNIKKVFDSDKLISVQRDDDSGIYQKRNLIISVASGTKSEFSSQSFLYFSDILALNSFCPHYAVFNLKVKNGKLYNNYFKHIPMYSPNCNTWHSCCTGSLPPMSREGIESLKISNLGSPFFNKIIDKYGTSYYIDLNIAKTKAILKETFDKEKKDE